jgi:hypothetical protein
MTQTQATSRTVLDEPYRPLVVWDFDGVIFPYTRGWHDGSLYELLSPEALDGMRYQQSALGMAVAVVTARPAAQLPLVAQALARQGHMNVAVDWNCRREFWKGGPDGTQILVSNRKLAAVAYIDDRGLGYRPGMNMRTLHASVLTLRDRARRSD